MSVITDEVSNPAVEWRWSGTRVFLFLRARTDHEDWFRPVNHSQSVLILTGDDLIATTDDLLNQALAEMTPRDLAGAITAARDREDRGEVVAQGPLGGEPVAPASWLANC
ncbi:MAG: hypothetical protein WEB00_02780 [Dehalococcoidia bacterium]